MVKKWIILEPPQAIGLIINNIQIRINIHEWNINDGENTKSPMIQAVETHLIMGEMSYVVLRPELQTEVISRNDGRRPEGPDRP